MIIDLGKIKHGLWTLAKLFVFLAFICNDYTDSWPKGSWAELFARAFMLVAGFYVLVLLVGSLLKQMVISYDKR